MLAAPLPVLAAWGARLPSARLLPPTCEYSGKAGKVRALLVGINTYQDVDASGRPYFSPLAGSTNDAHLLAETLKRRVGPGPPELRLLLDREASSESFYGALDALIQASRCGDFVVIHFSGHTWRGALALADASVRSGSGLVFEAELRRAVTAIRNRGAFVLVHIDANTPEPLELDVGHGGRWRAEGARTEDVVELAIDAGGFAGFYAGPLAFEQKVDLPLAGGSKETRVYGLFSFSTAAALGQDPMPSIRTLADRIRGGMTPRGRPGLEPTPLFESTEPDRGALATGLTSRLGSLSTLPPPAPTRPAAQSAPAALVTLSAPARIEILQPRRTRGVTLVTSPAIQVRGRVTPPDAVAAVVVSGTQARLVGGGLFEADLQIKPGPQTLYAVALFADHSVATDSVQVSGGPVPDPTAGVGSNYALVIGNGAYQHMPKLRTAVGDAEAVGELLRSRFGFQTSLPIGDTRPMSLVLKDVGRREVFGALAQLRRRLGENDSLLVFYAGHGDRPAKASQAYWLPIDAEPDDHANWISADDIASEVSLMNALHVLIVADSCFSGGLFRSGDATSPVTTREERTRYLEEMVKRRSRHLMSSGANEPVLDEGGGGHSVFARALLTGLEAMADDVFTAQQLFATRVQEVVAGKAGQTPQYGPVLRSGHDGGDFVFRRQATPAR